MQTGPYIAERLMPQIVAEYAAQTGIIFQSFSSEWVLRLEKEAKIRWIVGYKFDVNRSAASEVAQDKVATYAALNAAGIGAVPHYLVRSLPKELIDVQELHESLEGIPVVAKPLEGTAGRDVMRFATTDDALAMIRTSGEPAWALAPYLDLEAEYRCIMLEDECLLLYEKTQPAYRDGMKLFNLSIGAVAKDVSEPLRQELLPIAKRVMQTTALRLAAVDVVRLADGSCLVLEVNDGISMEHYARQSTTNEQTARRTYATIVDAMFP